MGSDSQEGSTGMGHELQLKQLSAALSSLMHEIRTANIRVDLDDAAKINAAMAAGANARAAFDRWLLTDRQ